jgi:hypothetical protein
VLRRLCTLAACLATVASTLAGAVACDKSRADVLAEFPPPRLAKEKATTAQPAEFKPTDCKGTWRLFGRKSRETYSLAGRGTFEVQGDPPRPTSGIVAFDPTEAKPELREAVERALQTRGKLAPWIWRVLSVDQPGPTYEGPHPNAVSIGPSGLSELEINGVRTRQTHDVTAKLTRHGGAPNELLFETQLRFDLAAHRVRGVVLGDDGPPRRSDLVVECRLTTEDDGQ